MNTVRKSRDFCAPVQLSRWVILFLLLLVPISGICDRVVFKNGDVISGSVTGYKDGNLEITTTAFGPVKTRRDAVSAVHTEQPVFVVFEDQTLRCDTITREKAGIRLSGCGAGNEFIEQPSILAIRAEATNQKQESLPKTNFLHRWQGTFDIGLSAARSDTSSTNLNVGMTAVRATHSDRLSLKSTSLYSQTRAEDQEHVETTAIRAGARYARNLNSRYFGFVFANFETDEAQSLDLRRVLGTSGGFRALSSERFRFDIFSGSSYLSESFGGEPHRTAGELLFGQELSYRPGATELSETLSFYPNLTDRGEYRTSLDLSASVALNRWLSWETTLSEIYITNPPYSTPGNTFLVTTGVALKLGKEHRFDPSARIEGY